MLQECMVPEADKTFTGKILTFDIALSYKGDIREDSFFQCLK